LTRILEKENLRGITRKKKEKEEYLVIIIKRDRFREGEAKAGTMSEGS